MHFLLLVGLHLLAASLAGASPHDVNENVKFVLPFEVFDGASTAEVLSVDGGLDLPKLTPGVNDSTFDWWYFDAVAATSLESLSIAFFNFGNTTLEVPYPGGSLVVQVSGTLSDGTPFLTYMAATRNASFVANDIGGIASHWDGEGGDFSFSGSSLDVPNITYTISGDDPDTGSFGSLTLTSVSPPRYPCSLNVPGASEEILPGLYWSNAVPDSDATVDLMLNGQPFRFKGYGYHDKRWGDRPLNDTVGSGYWGHGRLGPYSIVWLDALDKDGKEYVSSWISMNGTVVFQSCEDESVVVRPFSKDNTDPLYPPTPSLPAPDGYDIRYDLSDGRAFVARFTTSAIQLSSDTYKRMVGPLAGGFEGEEQYEGMALCEQVQN